MLDNYYNILNVDPSCTKKEIIMAYRRLALKWHQIKIRILLLMINL